LDLLRRRVASHVTMGIVMALVLKLGRTSVAASVASVTGFMAYATVVGKAIRTTAVAAGR
jgi:sorbitol-specific phosphotransferase system component IIBC